MKKIKCFSFLFILLCCITILKVAAQDTLKSQTIQIVSNYKPVLKPATKFGFSASSMPPVPFSDKFIYTLPDQQYRVLMRSVDLVPASFTPDSLRLYDHHFLKIGYGNFQRIYADAGTSWGAGKPLQLQLFAGHHSLKGNQLFQQNSRTYAHASVQYFFDHHILQLKANAHQNNYYFFGNDALTVNDKKDSLRVTYNQWSVEMGLKSQTPNAYGLTYDPSFRFHFLDAGKSNELNALMRIPLHVKINSQVSFSLQGKADITRYRLNGDTTYQNNIYSVSPSVLFPVKDFTFDIGLQAAWDNSMLNILPQIGVEAFIKSNKAILFAGVQSIIQKNNFQSLIQFNPWITAQRLQINTRIDEYFAGLRGTLPGNLSYRISGGLSNFYHLPLYLNIPKTSLFSVLHEGRMEAFRIKATAEWVHSEKISADIGMDFYQILKQKEENKPWHFIPMQVNMGIRWKPVKDLTIQSKIFGWEGPYFKIDNQGNAKKLPAVIDVNVEADFKISKLFLIWLQMNNIFNQQYQRWNQYPVVGFQLIGGIRLNFEQKK
jgi:hypothetical protein